MTAPTQNLTFELKSAFVLQLWKRDEEDSQAEKAKARQPDGIYLTNVLFSLERSLRVKNANAAALAKALHDRLIADLGALENSINEKYQKFTAQLASDIVKMPEVPLKATPVQLGAEYSRPSIVKFIRAFVLLDQCISVVYEHHRHGMIDKDAFYEMRRELARPLRAFMYNTSKVVKLYHQKRRELIDAEKPKAPKKEAAA